MGIRECLKCHSWRKVIPLKSSYSAETANINGRLLKKDHLNLPVNKFTGEQILGVGVKSHENSGSVMRIQGREREKKKKKEERKIFREGWWSETEVGPFN